MSKRLLLKPLWFTSAFSNTPTYLYFNEQEDTFEVGCRAQARKHKFEFSEEEIKQMGKDFDLSFFRALEEGKCGEEEG